MIFPLLILLTGLAKLPEASTPSDWFRLGQSLRDHANRARDAFAIAARGFDLDSPASALAKARAHALAGQTPQAIAALHAGLALAPADRELQGDLLAIRGTIRYPESSDPRLRVRPDPPNSFPERISPWDLYVWTGLSGAAAAIGLASWFTTRPRWSSAVAAFGLIALSLTVLGAIRITHRGTLAPAILGRAEILRTGNGSSYPPKLTEALPTGTEVTLKDRRGDWVRIEVAGGAAGWLPESALLR